MVVRVADYYLVTSQNLTNGTTAEKDNKKPLRLKQGLRGLVWQYYSYLLRRLLLRKFVKFS